MWSKYYRACPVARFPACVYLPLSRRNNLGRTADGEEPGARSQIRAEEVDRRDMPVSGRADLFLLETGLSTAMISRREAIPLESPKELTGSQLPSLAHQGT